MVQWWGLSQLWPRKCSLSLENVPQSYLRGCLPGFSPARKTKNSQAMLGTRGGVKTFKTTVGTNLLYVTIWESERRVITMNWKIWEKSYTTIFKTVRTTKYFDQLQRMPGNYFIVLIIGKQRHISTLWLSYFYCTNYTSQ